MGCDSVVFDPTTRITSEYAKSEKDEVEAPMPNALPRATAAGACQSRAQLSILLVPRPARIIRWKR